MNDLFDQSLKSMKDGLNEEDVENVGFDLQNYNEYMHEQNEKEGKKKCKKPKECDMDGNMLKIVKFETNKSKIKVRKLQEDNVIPRHPFRLLMVGRSGSGKSNCLINLMTRPHFYGRTNEEDKKTGYFDEIFLFSPTSDGGDDLIDQLDLPDTRIISNQSDFPEALQNIFKIQKDIIKKKKLDKSPKICIIFDDCQSAEKFLKSENFVKLFIAGRHYNISTICCGQSWTKFARVTRLNASNIMLYPSSNSEIQLLADEYTPAHTTKRDFKKLVAYATGDQYNFLHINNQVSDPNDRYRKNLDSIIDIPKSR